MNFRFLNLIVLISLALSACTPGGVTPDPQATGQNKTITPGTPVSSTPVILWESVDQPCETAAITLQGASYGPCQGSLNLAAFASADRATHLVRLTGAYQSFSAETAAGKVTFTGAGRSTATPAEQRAIAEWARLVFMEAEGGRGGAAWGLAFSWHRAGGIAGLCDDLAVYLDGEVIASSCRGQILANGGRFNLTSDQLEQLYTWTDGLRSFTVNQSNAPNVADGMTIFLNFSGTGQAQATQADQAAILSFTSELFMGAGQTNG